jgi:hypothetical protein
MSKKDKWLEDSERTGALSFVLIIFVGLIVSPFTSMWFPVYIVGFCALEYACIIVYLLLFKRYRKGLFWRAFGVIDSINKWPPIGFAFE